MFASDNAGKETAEQEELRSKLPELKEKDENAWIDALKKLGPAEHDIRCQALRENERRYFEYVEEYLYPWIEEQTSKKHLMPGKLMIETKCLWISGKWDY